MLFECQEGQQVSVTDALEVGGLVFVATVTTDLGIYVQRLDSAGVLRQEGRDYFYSRQIQLSDSDILWRYNNTCHEQPDGSFKTIPKSQLAIQTVKLAITRQQGQEYLSILAGSNFGFLFVYHVALQDDPPAQDYLWRVHSNDLLEIKTQKDRVNQAVLVCVDYVYLVDVVRQSVLRAWYV